MGESLGYYMNLYRLEVANFLYNFSSHIETHKFTTVLIIFIIVSSTKKKTKSIKQTLEMNRDSFLCDHLNNFNKTQFYVIQYKKILVTSVQ